MSTAAAAAAALSGHLRRHNLADRRVAVALSGGSDSLALTLLLLQHHHASPSNVLALTVDHALRPTSSQEAQQLSSWCRQHNLPHTTLTIPPLAPGPGIETRARNARYVALTQACVREGVSDLVVGHHGGDCEETCLMRLSVEVGGSRLRRPSYWCTPLPVARNPLGAHVYAGYGVRIHRPLLDVHKSALVQVCREAGEAWIEDRSNTMVGYTPRNAVRAIVGSGGLPQALGTARLQKLRQKALAATQVLAAVERQVLKAISLQINRAAAALSFDYRVLLTSLGDDEEAAIFVIERIAQLVSPTEQINREALFPVLHVLKHGYGSVTAAGLVWRIDGIQSPESTNCNVIRQPFLRGDLAIKSPSLAEADWTKWDHRFWLRDTGRGISAHELRVRALKVPDMAGLRAVAKAQGRLEELEFALARNCPGKIRFTLPAVVNDADQVLSLPSLPFRLDDSTAGIECSWAGESLMNSFLEDNAGVVDS